MSFDLFNTPASFKGYIIKIFIEKLNIFIFIYLNNILIYIKDFGQLYMEAIQRVSKQLQKYDIFDKLKKC